MKALIRHSNAIVVLLAVAATMGYAKDPKRIERRLGSDSTIFTLKLPSNHIFYPGKFFKVKIHVRPREGWHVYSADMESGDCMCGPLRVTIPNSISDYFEVTGLKEIGDARTWYDSNFMATHKAYFAPYDLVATVKVKKSARSEVPFSVFVTYMAVDSQHCLPPRTFAVPMSVLGDEPINLSILPVDRSGKPSVARAQWLGSRLGR